MDIGSEATIGNPGLKLVGTGPPAGNSLTVLLAGGDEGRRRELTTALAGTRANRIREVAFPAPDTLSRMLTGDCDVLIVVFDENPDDGLKLVEAACGSAPGITVMVYARAADPALLVRAMQAGAREFLTDPLPAAAIRDAVLRAAARRDEIGRRGRTGKCLVFLGAKGGSGVTTVAGNFAVALAKESGQGVVLLDLNLRLGDAALNLGLSSQFSTLDALKNESRLDSELLSTLLVTHGSGLRVLAAPDEYNAFRPEPGAVMKLVGILMRDFDWVVVDAGTHENGFGPELFDISEKVYLVTQVSVPELRNSNRFVTALFKGSNNGKLEVVVNRCDTRTSEISDAGIEKALTLAPAWKIPNDYHSVRTAQNTATALYLNDSPIARVLTRMARSVCGKPMEEVAKRRFGLFH